MTSVEGYEVDGLVGKGSTGAVFRAHDAGRPESPVALKRIPQDGGGDGGILRREWQILSQLQHPNIVRAHELIDDLDGVTIVMDYVPGGSLAERLHRAGALAPDAVVAMATPLAEALHVVHQAGIVHGDVKPASILFSDDDRPLLCDFGAARGGGYPSGSRSEIVGTAGYIDPHVLAGGEPSPASDIYALGRVCQDALTAGRRDGPMAQGISHPLTSVVARATASDPAARFDTAAEMAAALRGCGEELTADPGPRLPPTRNFGPRPAVTDADGPAPKAQDVGPGRSGRKLLVTMVTAIAAVVGTVATAAWLAKGPSPVRLSRVSTSSASSAPTCPRDSSPAVPPAGTLLKGDLRGDGCVDAVVALAGDLTVPAGVDHPEVRYHLGRPGDQLLLGDWNCDGRATAGLYRPATGQVMTFDGWARPGQPAPAASVARARRGGVAKVVRRPTQAGRGCDRVVVMKR